LRQSYVAITLLQTSSLTFTKLSLMLFYRRVFRTGSRQAVGVLIHTMNALIIIWGLGYVLSFIFTCGTHFNYLWSSTADTLKCPLSLPKIDLSLSISDAIMDVLIMVFPIPLVRFGGRRSVIDH
jgi:hypothetical protein